MGIQNINGLNGYYNMPYGYNNRPQVNFMGNPEQPQQPIAETLPEQKEGMSSGMKWMLGAAAVVTVVALGFAGRAGKLGEGIQKFLGGAEKAAGTATNGIQQAAEKYKGLTKADKDETIAWLKSKNIEAKVRNNKSKSVVEYTASNGRKVELTYNDKNVLSSIDSNKGDKNVYLGFVDKKLSVALDSNGRLRVYDDGKVIDDTLLI